MAILSIVLLLAGVTAAMADHASKGINVPTLTATGAAAGPTDAYSPKQTCGGCHFNCTTGGYTTDTTLYCQTGQKKDCSVAGNCPDYESLATTTVNKVQGYPTGSGTVLFQNYTVKGPMHGASVGKHSTQGRNEEWTAALRTIWGAPAFTSSPGMWGRY
jgi:hypothetical protein